MGSWLGSEQAPGEYSANHDRESQAVQEDPVHQLVREEWRLVTDESPQATEPQQCSEAEEHRVDHDEIVSKSVSMPFACETILTRPIAVRQTPIIPRETEKTVSVCAKACYSIHMLFVHRISSQGFPRSELSVSLDRVIRLILK